MQRDTSCKHRTVQFGDVFAQLGICQVAVVGKRVFAQRVDILGKLHIAQIAFRKGHTSHKGNLLAKQGVGKAPTAIEGLFFDADNALADMYRLQIAAILKRATPDIGYPDCWADLSV